MIYIIILFYCYTHFNINLHSIIISICSSADSLGLFQILNDIIQQLLKQHLHLSVPVIAGSSYFSLIHKIDKI